MKEIQKFALLASIVGFVALLYVKFSWLESSLAYETASGEKVSELFSTFDKATFDLYLSLFIGALHHGVTAVWLFYAAKSEALSKLTWSLFGLSFGVVGVACFYAASVHFQLKKAMRKKTT